MYDFLDRSVTNLDHGGRLLVWSARSWVKAVGERKCPASAIARVFGKWDMLQGLHPFLRMMALFNQHGLQDFGFCTLPCDHISEHEAILISLMCSLRDSRPETVRKTLDLLVEEEVVGDLILSLTHLGQAMDKAGIYPARPRPGATTQGARTQAPEQ